MIKQLLIIFFILVNYTSNSAFSQDSTKTKIEKWGIGIQVNTIEKFAQYDNALLEYYGYFVQGNEWKNNSSSFGLIGNYFVNENIFLRCRVGLTNIKLYQFGDSRNNTNNPGSLYNIGELNIRQKRYHFAPGIGGEIRKNNFGLYGGFDIPFNSYGQYKVESSNDEYDTTNTITFSYKSHRTAPGGYSIGISAFAGFKFYFLKHFSIGAEISSALMYYKLGGTIITIGETLFPTGMPNAIYSTLYTVKGFEYAGERLSLNIIYFFNTNKKIKK